MREAATSCPACGEGYGFDPIADDTVLIRVFTEDLDALRPHLPSRVDVYIGTSETGVSLGDWLAEGEDVLPRELLPKPFVPPWAQMPSDDCG